MSARFSVALANRSAVAVVGMSTFVKLRLSLLISILNWCL